MKQLLLAFVAGLIFAIGLGVSGMTQADKVIGFLELGRSWDPSLAVVMLGAMGGHMLLYRFIKRQESPLFAERFRIPTRRDIDARLVTGAGIFGVGWALGGYCPGPGLVAMTSGQSAALVFVGGLAIGMLIFRMGETAMRARSPEPTPGQ